MRINLRAIFSGAPGKRNTETGVLMKDEQKYSLVINHGLRDGFEHRELERDAFVKETSKLLKKPRKIFLGLGDFLEVGDYKKLLDSIFFEEEGAVFENILDRNNRKIAEEGDIPFSFFKMAVYFPDFLLKEVPTFCTSVIGKKSRLFPGAANFVKNIKEYNPTVLSAMPYEIAVEFARRVGLEDRNVISTQYKIKRDSANRDVYAGDITRFLSGDRKSLEIEKSLGSLNLRDDECVYIGTGEAGVKTFSHVNSIAFNPPPNISSQSRISLYGSSLESILTLFNFNGELQGLLDSPGWDDFLPSLIVYSAKKEKSPELTALESEHLVLQNNIIGQRIEHSGESYISVEREIEITFGGSFVNMQEVRGMIEERMRAYREKPQELVREIYRIAKQRYNNFCTV
jgi:hypothetical protein